MTMMRCTVGRYQLVDDLREPCHGSHPLALTDRGLLAAVNSCARRMPIPATARAEPAVATARFTVEVGVGQLSVLAVTIGV
jgi:hypothetical protein